MRILLYAGPAPSREAVLLFSAQIIQNCATSLTLVTGGGAERRPLLEDAAARLGIPDRVPVALSALAGNSQVAILAAARAQPYDLVILGRLHQPFGRLLPGAHSKAIAQRLEPSVLRIHGPVRPIRRILISSGGDYHTFADVEVAAQIAAPLGAAVKLLHVVSQQSLLFEGFQARRGRVEFAPSLFMLRCNIICLRLQCRIAAIGIGIADHLHLIRDGSGRLLTGCIGRLRDLVVG